MNRRPNTEQRLHRLLNDLDEECFRPPPVSVGLKTMVRARIEGLIEMGDDLKNPVARITTAGQLWRDEQGFRGHDYVVTDSGHLI
jgi:hypothetical protein